MQAKRKLPLGVSNFEMLRDKDLVYIDKTKYIELLEQEYNHILFFTRPRKFGKSLFLNMLGHYYDINKKDRFEHLFGNLYIGKNPTANRNKFLVLKFNFSGLDTSDKEQFLKSFSEKINIDVQYFLKEYMEQFPQIKDAYDKIKNDFSTSVGGAVGLAIQAAKDIKTKLYVVIDEYDHFANDLMAGSKYRDNNFYNNVIRANSVVRDFYETLKIGVETSIERIILTGVTPIMLDDVTSGFNISHNISLDERYNEILGFTEDDLEQIITETNLNRDLINIDLKLFYNGYKFHTLGQHRVYNPSMMMYYFGELLMKNRTPDTFIDENLRMDYGRLKGLLNSEQSKNQLLEIAEKGCITSNIVRSFSAEKVQSPQNLISLLFYMGLLTIDKPAGVEMILKIPNYSIKTTYWEYIERIAEDEYPDLITDLSKHTEAINQLAYYSNPKP
ncbi:MAG: AAA family ATPase [Bacteroidales bacterium]|jgi:hypothetical protein|nr:AAA family ATPase [Bacteroidales bacterium]